MEITVTDLSRRSIGVAGLFALTACGGANGRDP